MFHGSIVALVTPMDESGQIDFAALTRLINLHLDAGTDALAVAVTTSESLTLTVEEHHAVVEHVIRIVAGRCPVIAGASESSTARAVNLARAAMQQGADACLIMAPYGNKPTQEGLYLHYKTIAREVPIPIILYNVPSRTASDLLPETVARLAEIPNIVGIKEATGDIGRAQLIHTLCEGRIDVLSGDDETALELMFNRAKGVISVTANVAPSAMHQMCKHALQGDFMEARRWNEVLLPLHRALFLEANPIPAKWALQQMGLIKSGIRLPLTPLSTHYHDKIRQALHHADIPLAK